MNEISITEKPCYGHFPPNFGRLLVENHGYDPKIVAYRKMVRTFSIDMRSLVEIGSRTAT